MGMSGTGKSSLSQELQKMGYRAYDMDEIEGLCTMLDTKTKLPPISHNNDDLEKVKNIEWVCNIAKLRNLIETDTSPISFYCGAVSNFEEIVPFFTDLMVLKANPDAIRHRLSNRTTNDFGRTREVQDWLLNSKEEGENALVKKGVIPIDANKNLKQVAQEVIENLF